MLMLREPYKLKDIRDVLKMSSASYFKKQYIDPLVSDGYLDMTRPTKPNSSRQMYCLTEKSQQLLSQVNVVVR